MAPTEKVERFIGKLAEDVGLRFGRRHGWYAVHDADGNIMAAHHQLEAIEYYIHGYRTGITLCQKSGALNDQGRTEEERG